MLLLISNLSNILFNSSVNTLIEYLFWLFIFVVLFESIICGILLYYSFENKKELDEVKIYNTNLLSINDNLKCFKHDLNNILQSIGGFIEVEDIKSLKRYYKDLLKDSYSISSLDNLNPNIVNNPSIYSLLSCKYHKAVSKNVQMNFNINTGFDNLDINDYELSRILGILLDNSIEASAECNEKIVNIKLCQNSTQNCNLLIIENTYLNKDIDTIKIFEKSYTTKPQNTGLGLWEINKILNKHSNLSLFTTKDNTFFTQQLEIYKN